MKISTPRLTQNLEYADRLRRIAASIKFDETMRKILEDQVPQIVVLGMTSAGKSSVLTRLSGVKFPRDKDLCTRVKIELKLRRQETPQYAVKLCGREGVLKTYPQTDNRDSISEQIKEAQEDAYERFKSTKQPISEDYWIEIEAHGPSEPNMTLVDLPGLIQAQHEKENGFKEMVDKLAIQSASKPNSHVLHVMAVDTVYANNFSMKLVNQLKESHLPDVSKKGANSQKGQHDLTAKRIVHVFTKYDKLDHQDELKAYLQNTTSDPRFAVRGDLENDDPNDRALFSHEKIPTSAQKLGEYLENIIADHIEAARATLDKELARMLREKQTELAGLTRTLDNTGTIAALKDIFRDKITSNKDYENDIRDVLETMGQRIRKCYLRPLRRTVHPIIDGTSLRPAGKLEPGDEVWVKKPGDRAYSNVTISKVEGENFCYTTGSSTISVALSQGFLPDLEVLLCKDVVHAMSKSGIGISLLVSRKDLLAPYMKEFSSQYHKILLDTVEIIHTKALQMLRAICIDLQGSFSWWDGKGVCDEINKFMNEDLNRVQVAAESYSSDLQKRGTSEKPYVGDEVSLLRDFNEEKSLPVFIQTIKKCLDDASGADGEVDAISLDTEQLIKAAKDLIKHFSLPLVDEERREEQAREHIRVFKVIWKSLSTSVSSEAKEKFKQLFVDDLEAKTTEILTNNLAHFATLVQEKADNVAKRNEVESLIKELKTIVQGTGNGVH